ncbi:MAG: glutathione S-transferase family protein [Rhodobacteraceae bacterium]|nr:glutathione S-transferase family protein [Paracoccaceae bacterium]
MLKLITFPPAFGAPSMSPFGTKVMCLLNMSGAEWQVHYAGDTRKSPKKKLPVLKDGDKIIPDSNAIRAYLEQKLDFDFDAGLSAEQRATSHMLIKMLEEHTYFIGLVERWSSEDNWQIMRRKMFENAPKWMEILLANKIRKKMLAQAYAQGMARHSEKERLQLAKADMAAIRTVLGDKDFLFGAAPTAADATAVPFLITMAHMPAATKISKHFAADKTLMDYVERGKAAMYQGLKS